MLAFLFCLCLAIVGVVGDLTDADLTKIGTLFDAHFGDLKGQIGDLKGQFGDLKGQFGDLKGQFGLLNTSVGAQIGDLKTYFTTAFSDSHFFNRNRVEMLRKVSAKFVPCPKQSGTSHTVVFEGRVATVFTPHSDCLNSHAFSPTNNGNYILDDMYDLAIDIRCSNT